MWAFSQLANTTKGAGLLQWPKVWLSRGFQGPSGESARWMVLPPSVASVLVCLSFLSLFCIGMLPLESNPDEHSLFSATTVDSLPVPMWISANFPSASWITFGLWEKAGTATCWNSYGPVMRSETACSIWDCECQCRNEQLLRMAEAYKWYLPFWNRTSPPQVVFWGDIPYPWGKDTGRSWSISQSIPVHGLSQIQTPVILSLSPFKEHGGGGGGGASAAAAEKAL